jgi:hypothetical protein
MSDSMAYPEGTKFLGAEMLLPEGLWYLKVTRVADGAVVFSGHFNGGFPAYAPSAVREDGVLFDGFGLATGAMEADWRRIDVP